MNSVPRKELQPLISAPIEGLGAEYKSWLNLTEKDDRAKLVKAIIAMANHGGGYVILGMTEQDGTLCSVHPEEGIPIITQDSVNNAVRRYVEAPLHCAVYSIDHPDTDVSHPVVVVPSDTPFPVMAKASRGDILVKNRCYIRKPGPMSEEPHTSEEWRQFLGRCLQSRKQEMLEAIRGIVSGRVEPNKTQLDARDELRSFCADSHRRWENLIDSVDSQSPVRLANGWYEMGFFILVDAPAQNLSEVRNRINSAGRIRLSGWAPFLDFQVPGKSPSVSMGCVEAWLGRPVAGKEHLEEAMTSDFWRASKDGKLYTLRGYQEDSSPGIRPGAALDVSMPIWRTTGALLFAVRLADEFDGGDEIVVQLRFSGLSGRSLASISRRLPVFPNRISRSDSIESITTVTLQQSQDNIVEIVHSMLLPLYEMFDFFELTTDLVAREVKALMSGRY